MNIINMPEVYFMNTPSTICGKYTYRILSLLLKGILSYCDFIKYFKDLSQ